MAPVIILSISSWRLSIKLISYQRYRINEVFAYMVTEKQTYVPIRIGLNYENIWIVTTFYAPETTSLISMSLHVNQILDRVKRFCTVGKGIPKSTSRRPTFGSEGG